MEENVNNVIQKVARGEATTKEELTSVANLFANATTSVAVFARRDAWFKWAVRIGDVHLSTLSLFADNDWQQNIDRALDFGDIIIIDNVEQSEEIYNALNANEKVKTKVIMRGYPMPKDSGANGVTIYRNLTYLHPRALRYAIKVSIVLRHAIIPLDLSSIPILHLDDVVANKLLIKTLLKMHGVSQDFLYQTSNNLEAIFLMEKHHPLIMITDVNHVGGNGFDLVKMLSEKEEFDDTVMGYLTALNCPTDEERGFAFGGDFFMVKPFSKNGILALVDSCALTAQYVKVYNEVMNLH